MHYTANEGGPPVGTNGGTSQVPPETIVVNPDTGIRRRRR